MVALRKDDEFTLGNELRRGRPRIRCITSRDVPLPLVPSSMLVDGMAYEDDGCEFASSCLKCPFSKCKYDDPDIFRLDAARRDREIAQLRRDHHAPIEALMQTYGLSRTHVYRALREHGVLRPWKKKDPAKEEPRRRKRRKRDAKHPT
jgi:hypothetical protein